MTETSYLDWNAAAPLCSEAREAMIAAMDVVGNPSSVHIGGRRAKAVIDAARENVAALVDCAPSEVVFTSGATEACNWVLRDPRWSTVYVPPVEHDAVLMAAERAPSDSASVAVNGDGIVNTTVLRQFLSAKGDTAPLICIQAANSETGVVQDLRAVTGITISPEGRIFTDACQAVGRRDDAGNTFSFAESGVHFAAITAEKFGGPAGVGALIVRKGCELKPFLVGGGQEMRYRSGTENLIGIAGMGAAARAARENPIGKQVYKRSVRLRALMTALADDVEEVGQRAPRLVNTTCFTVPNWPASTQMMQLDLKGVAISAGSACSSGKVSESKVLRAMGYSRDLASSAIRVSIGPTTTDDDIAHFADVWSALYKTQRAKARDAASELDQNKLKGNNHG